MDKLNRYLDKFYTDNCSTDKVKKVESRNGKKHLETSLELNL